MKILFSVISMTISCFLSIIPAYATPKNQFSTTAIVAFFEHENPDSNINEEGWLPGLNFGLSHSSKNMLGIISTDIYAGDATFNSGSNTDNLTATINEKLVRISYRLESAFPRRIFQVYSLFALQRWNRSFKLSQANNGIDRKYEWWTFEAGIKATLFKSNSNLFYADIGLSKSFSNELQIDLQQLNLGKPLFKPSPENGAAMSVNYAHFFTQHEGIKLSISARYWKFGEVTRNIDNFGQIVKITETASNSTLIGSTVSYFYQF